MLNDDKKFLICIFVVVFTVEGSAVFIIISNDALAQTLYDRRLSKLANQTIDNQNWVNNFQIHVGDRPQLIAVNDPTNTIYVVNRNFGEVSVIDGWNHRKIGEDIPVGDGPVAIAVNVNTNTVYVANYHSDSISLIDARDNTKIGEDIPVGDGPVAIDVNLNTNRTYVANYLTNSISVIDGTTSELLRNIAVERGPKDIVINYPLNKIYTANYRNDSISVIDGTTNNVTKNIAVGDGPVAMIVNPNTNALYVVNNLDNTVSVIYGDDTKREQNIDVGNSPREVDINPKTNTLYIVNSLNNTVSVINGTNNNDTKIVDDIQVKAEPWDVSYNQRTNATYIVNAASDSISVIDGFDNKVLAGVIFRVNPFNSGYILCGGSITPSPLNQYFFIEEPGIECIAKPYTGYEFASWEENLENNSTQLIKLSRPISYWDLLGSGISRNTSSLIPYEPDSKLHFSTFGAFTANFRELPPPIPQEYMLLLVTTFFTGIGTIVTAIVIGWFGSRKKEKDPFLG